MRFSTCNLHRASSVLLRLMLLRFITVYSLWSVQEISRSTLFHRHEPEGTIRYRAWSWRTVADTLGKYLPVTLQWYTYHRDSWILDISSRNLFIFGLYLGICFQHFCKIFHLLSTYFRHRSVVSEAVLPTESPVWWSVRLLSMRQKVSFPWGIHRWSFWRNRHHTPCQGKLEFLQWSPEPFEPLEW